MNDVVWRWFVVGYGDDHLWGFDGECGGFSVTLSGSYCTPFTSVCRPRNPPTLPIPSGIPHPKRIAGRIDTDTSFLRLNCAGPIVHTSATVESFVCHQDYQILKESIPPVKRFTNDGFGLIYTKSNTSPLPSKSSLNTTFWGTLSPRGPIFIGTSYATPRFFIPSAIGYPAFYHTTPYYGWICVAPAPSYGKEMDKMAVCRRFYGCCKQK